MLLHGARGDGDPGQGAGLSEVEMPARSATASETPSAPGAASSAAGPITGQSSHLSASRSAIASVRRKQGDTGDAFGSSAPRAVRAGVDPLSWIPNPLGGGIHDAAIPPVVPTRAALVRAGHQAEIPHRRAGRALAEAAEVRNEHEPGLAPVDEELDIVPAARAGPAIHAIPCKRATNGAAKIARFPAPRTPPRRTAAARLRSGAGLTSVGNREGSRAGQARRAMQRTRRIMSGEAAGRRYGTSSR